MKPDEIDARILGALIDDGRASLRQIAKRTSLTTPTVSARFDRMKKSGMIRKFVPVLSPDSVGRGVFAVISLKVNSSSAEKLGSDLSKLPEVENVYVTTGQGMTLKVALSDVAGLQKFLSRRVLARPGVSVASSQIITKVVKEEPAPLSPSALIMNLKCDFCHEEVARARPYTLTTRSSRYYFCCKTCRNAYLEKFGPRLARIKHGEKTALRM
ncbi:MAG: AsnC family transcriptional regulator [Thaumarchaeota archaeon]|nr:AsnC family transcriptional regulator [Nitrososphaerota archaeon]